MRKERRKRSCHHSTPLNTTANFYKQVFSPLTRVPVRSRFGLAVSTINIFNTTTLAAAGRLAQPSNHSSMLLPLPYKVFHHAILWLTSPIPLPRGMVSWALLLHIHPRTQMVFTPERPIPYPRH